MAGTSHLDDERPIPKPLEAPLSRDEARLRRIVARHDPHMYLGTFVTCVFNADRALCQTPDAPGVGQPVLADRQPLACRNTALTPANRRALNGHLAELEEALADRDHLAPYIRHRLEEQHRGNTLVLQDILGEPEWTDLRIPR
ncbi:hypothetical protein PYK79_33215 [Streptomyces sp. ID05-04B]|uniref:Uncharacterized protein n=1 Tax=Streptomyces brasiliscabiei TaxID=2736302 RepID=A0ABU8GM04_9ACTN|nr:hypothetical protein [Streptomyces sp. ID05-04B]MDX5567142.1 hypothetical protein [Streptomyces sp. ID05-04B]